MPRTSYMQFIRAHFMVLQHLTFLSCLTGNSFADGFPSPFVGTWRIVQSKGSLPNPIIESSFFNNVRTVPRNRDGSGQDSDLSTKGEFLFLLANRFVFIENDGQLPYSQELRISKVDVKASKECVAHHELRSTYMLPNGGKQEGYEASGFARLWFASENTTKLYVDLEYSFEPKVNIQMQLTRIRQSVMKELFDELFNDPNFECSPSIRELLDNQREP